MNDAESDVLPRALFRKRGLILAPLPEPLASTLQERSRWCFSTRALPTHPFGHQHYVDEVDLAFSTTDENALPDYAIIAHAGHGLNSSGILYFLVHDGLALFIKVAWGGAFMDNTVCTANANRAFALTTALCAAAERSPRLQGASGPGSARRERLIVVASDLTESRWRAPGGAWEEAPPSAQGMFQVIEQATAWLQSRD
jgi:hypothetical protein